MTDFINNVSAVKATPSVSSATYHTKERYKQLENFVQSSFIGCRTRIETLQGDASFRRYHRVYVEPLTAGVEFDDTYIVMDAPPQLESVESFIRVDLLLATKVNVPTILAKDFGKGLLLLQDFGNVEFAHLVADAKANKDGIRLDELYHWAMHELMKIQTINIDLARHSFNIADYDAQLLQNEMDLFTQWFLPYIGVSLSSQEQDDWHTFTQHIIHYVMQQPQVVVHRDYHSRNLMQDQYHLDLLGVIDFQDAVIGPYTYDLVSLVRDAYVDFSEAKVNRWIKYFWRHGTKQPKTSLEQFTAEVNLMGIQRHLKVLGIFVRLSERDGKSRYLADIPKVWRDLLSEISWLVQHADDDIRDCVASAYHILEQSVLPKFIKKFNT